jgi:hypothetical protein
MNKFYILPVFLSLVAAVATALDDCNLNNMNASRIKCNTALIYDPGAGQVIQISIKNVSSSELVFFEDQLPWGPASFTTLVAIPLEGSGEPVVPILKLVDPTVKRVSLKPGEAIDGRIILKQRFNGWNQILANKEVSVFWSFVVDDAEARAYGRYSGFSVITPNPAAK